MSPSQQGLLEEQNRRYEQGSKAAAEILTGLQLNEQNADKNLFERGFQPWYDQLTAEQRQELTRATLGPNSNEEVFKHCEFRALRLHYARSQKFSKLAYKLAKEAFDVVVDVEKGYYSEAEDVSETKPDVDSFQEGDHPRDDAHL